MAETNQNSRKQVRLTVYDNEPVARMAEQRLWQSGIPCVIRSLRGGPGLWGSAYNLPHDLCVYENDEARARRVLGLPQPLDGETDAPANGSRRWLWLVLVVAAVVVLLGIVLPALSDLG